MKAAMPSCPSCKTPTLPTTKNTLAAVKRTARLALQPGVVPADHGDVTGQAKSTKKGKHKDYEGIS